MYFFLTLLILNMLLLYLRHWNTQSTEPNKPGMAHCTHEGFKTNKQASSWSRVSLHDMALVQVESMEVRRKWKAFSWPYLLFQSYRETKNGDIDPTQTSMPNLKLFCWESLKHSVPQVSPQPPDKTEWARMNSWGPSPCWHSVVLRLCWYRSSG